MMDSDPAELYGVETRRLNEQSQKKYMQVSGGHHVPTNENRI